jgi:two-component system, cell cycle response regulator
MARILVIEDDAASLELMAYLLIAFGHAALTAPDGEVGLALARRETVDLILCDIQMPKLNGFDVVAQLKANPQLRATPCIAVTAFAMVGDRDRMLTAGFDGYVTKPIDPDTFVGQVEAFLPKEQNGAAPSIETEFAAATPAPPVAPKPEAETGGRLPTILIVDNSPENLEFLRSLFEYTGYAVGAVGTVGAALEQARRESPDLILCDLHLQGESGLDFLRLVRADPHIGHLPFVITSSTSWQRQDQLEALAMGVSKFILRPIEPALLLAEVEACLMQAGGSAPNVSHRRP